MPEQPTADSRRSFRLRVWGPFACFTRPELKAERFSYPVMTPSAARGIFDAIYCKPLEFRWQIEKIEVLEPPVYIALRRNEVKEKSNVNAIQRWIDEDAETGTHLGRWRQSPVGLGRKGAHATPDHGA